MTPATTRASTRSPVRVEVVLSEERIDLRGWARNYARAILRAEGFDHPDGPSPREAA
jgi:hypothetical protein